MKLKTKILGLFIGLLLIAPLSYATQITVSKDGDITSVQQGIDQAQPGDTVLVKEGRYVEYDIRINKHITLLGEGKAIIDGDNQGFVVVVKADSTVIKDIEVHNSKAGFM